MITTRTLHCAQHARHVGTCPACQRVRLAAERQQLAEVDAITAATADGRPPLANGGPVRFAAADGPPSLATSSHATPAPGSSTSTALR